MRISTIKSSNGVKSKSKSKGSKCRISREEFQKAKPIMVTLGGTTLEANPRTFSTGSLGFYLSGKAMVEVGGVMCEVQVSGNIVLIGSKEV